MADEEVLTDAESMVPDSKAVENERSLWKRYLKLTDTPSRFVRVVTCVVAYLLTFRLLNWAGVFTSAGVPVRGEWSHVLDRAITQSEVVVYCLLLFFVLDATILAANLIGKLTPHIPRPSQLDENHAIHLINELSGAVAGLVYLPFSVLFMMLVARNSLFDAYSWPPSAIAHFGSGLLLIVVAAITLQHRARAAKQAALDNLNENLLVFLRSEARKPEIAVPAARFGEAEPYGEATERRGQRAAAARSSERISDNSKFDPETSEQLLRENRDQITAFSSVAFRDWHHNPIFRAILIPLGGVGSLQLLERFSGSF